MYDWDGERVIVLGGIGQVPIDILCITCSPCKKKSKSFTLCLNARQPGKVSNGLNARQSEMHGTCIFNWFFPLSDLSFLCS